ncbi:hypothetical protein KBTX_04253 [wastewater metagenome]|uniref:Uncharacterized protein n=2 Tax=unclassified sequences TaxID=12908 RepID=A0A5B8RLG3_9ZZZZ|nr:hypothetical protein KBTEX_04253 [uncultured organism]
MIVQLDVERCPLTVDKPPLAVTDNGRDTVIPEGPHVLELRFNGPLPAAIDIAPLRTVVGTGQSAVEVGDILEPRRDCQCARCIDESPAILGEAVDGGDIVDVDPLRGQPQRGEPLAQLI